MICFKKIDTDNSGRISKSEFISALQNVMSDVKEMSKHFDFLVEKSQNKDGLLNYEDFVASCGRKQ